jgi:hypothetical protein
LLEVREVVPEDQPPLLLWLHLTRALVRLIAASY